MRIRRRYEDDGEHEAGGEDDSSLDGRGEGALGALAGGMGARGRRGLWSRAPQNGRE